VRKLEGVPGIAGIELNISCPNVGKGGLQFAVDAEAARAVTAAVRAETELPLMVKLSPNVADVRTIARAIEDGGAVSISAINTLSGIAVDLHARRPLLGNVYGGVSGPAIKPIALRVLYEVAQVVDIPVVGIGGIGTVEDALEFFFVGASAVQVGTAIFADPTVPARIVDGLAGYLAEHGYGAIGEIVGLALPKGTRGSHRLGSRGQAPQQSVPPSVKGVEYRP
jgi:dihydroorotate dehydrogenase (NAD+) catalytic subunit